MDSARKPPLFRKPARFIRDDENDDVTDHTVAPDSSHKFRQPMAPVQLTISPGNAANVDKMAAKLKKLELSRKKYRPAPIELSTPSKIDLDATERLFVESSVESFVPIPQTPKNQSLREPFRVPVTPSTLRSDDPRDSIRSTGTYITTTPRLNRSILPHTDPFTPHAMTPTPRKFNAQSGLLHEEKLEKQFVALSSWANVILDSSSFISEIDLGTSKQDASRKLQEMLTRPMKKNPDDDKPKSKYADLYVKKKCLDYLKRADSVYKSIGMPGDLKRMIEKQEITIKQDIEVYANIGVQTSLLSLLFSLHPFWLFLGVETVCATTDGSSSLSIESRLPFSGSSFAPQMVRFIHENILANTRIMSKKKFAIGTVKKIVTDKGKEALHSHCISSILSIAVLLEYSKNSYLFENTPGLFVKNSEIKSMTDFCTEFSRLVLSASGTPLNKAFDKVKFVRSYTQSFLEDYDYVIHSIKDLADGIVLGRLIELLTGSPPLSITGGMRNPQGDRLRKKGNVEKALNGARERGIEIEGISSESIIGAHKESCLNLLWRLVGVYVKMKNEEEPLRRESITMDYLSPSSSIDMDCSTVSVLGGVAQTAFEIYKQYGVAFGIPISFWTDLEDGRLLASIWRHFNPSAPDIRFYDGRSLFDKVASAAASDLNIPLALTALRDERQLGLFAHMFLVRLISFRRLRETDGEDTESSDGSVISVMRRELSNLNEETERLNKLRCDNERMAEEKEEEERLKKKEEDRRARELKERFEKEEEERMEAERRLEEAEEATRREEENMRILIEKKRMEDELKKEMEEKERMMKDQMEREERERLEREEEERLNELERKRKEEEKILEDERIERMRREEEERQRFEEEEVRIRLEVEDEQRREREEEDRIERRRLSISRHIQEDIDRIEREKKEAEEEAVRQAEIERLRMEEEEREREEARMKIEEERKEIERKMEWMCQELREQEEEVARMKREEQEMNRKKEATLKIMNWIYSVVLIRRAKKELMVLRETKVLREEEERRMNEAASIIQVWWRDEMIMRNARNELELMKEMKRMNEEEERGRIMNKAASTIQHWLRSQLLMRYARDELEIRRENKRMEEEEEKGRIRNGAACVIQKWMKGLWMMRMAKNELERRREDRRIEIEEENERIRLDMIRRKEEDEKRMKNNAAITIQRWIKDQWICRDARKELKMIREKRRIIEISTIKIQRWVRNQWMIRVAKNELNRRREERRLLKYEEERRVMEEQREYNRRVQAAIVIQRLWHRYQVMKEARIELNRLRIEEMVREEERRRREEEGARRENELYEEMNRNEQVKEIRMKMAVRIIQRSYRAYSEKMKTRRNGRVEQFLQVLHGTPVGTSRKTIGGYSTDDLLVGLRLIKRRQRKLSLTLGRMNTMPRVKAATKIQAWWRGVMTRRSLRVHIEERDERMAEYARIGYQAHEGDMEHRALPASHRLLRAAEALRQGGKMYPIKVACFTTLRLCRLSYVYVERAISLDLLSLLLDLLEISDRSPAFVEVVEYAIQAVLEFVKSTSSIVRLEVNRLSKDIVSLTSHILHAHHSNSLIACTSIDILLAMKKIVPNEKAADVFKNVPFYVKKADEKFKRLGSDDSRKKKLAKLQKCFL